MSRLALVAIASSLLPLTAHAYVARPRLPDRLAVLIHTGYKDNAAAETNVRNLFIHSIDAFDAAWARYLARRKVVDAALADAKAKQASGDIDGAIATLRGVITKTDLASGTKRQMLEERDAELPAIGALIELAAQLHNYTLAYDSSADLAVRRHVTDFEKERMRWIAFRNREALENLTAGMTQDTFKEIQALTRDADDAALEGKRLAGGVGPSLRELGVHFAAFGDPKSAKPGDWIYATLSKAKLDGTKLTYHLLDTTPIRYDCHDTDKIDYLNPVNGVIVWREECKTKPNKVEIWIDATLAQEAPASVTSSSMPFGVIGHVDKAGPHWKLSVASVVDIDTTSNLSGFRVSETEKFEAGGKIGVEKR